MSDEMREAFEHAISEGSFEPNSEFPSFYDVDEGNLYWLWGRAWQAALASKPQVSEGEIAEIARLIDCADKVAGKVFYWLTPEALSRLRNAVGALAARYGREKNDKINTSALLQQFEIRRK